MTNNNCYFAWDNWILSHTNAWIPASNVRPQVPIVAVSDGFPQSHWRGRAPDGSDEVVQTMQKGSVKCCKQKEGLTLSTLTVFNNKQKGRYNQKDQHQTPRHKKNLKYAAAAFHTYMFSPFLHTSKPKTSTKIIQTKISPPPKPQTKHCRTSKPMTFWIPGSWCPTSAFVVAPPGTPWRATSSRSFPWRRRPTGEPTGDLLHQAAWGWLGGGGVLCVFFFGGGIAF